MRVIYEAKWAQSRQKKDIELFHSPDLFVTPSPRPIIIIGGVHGDEPEGVTLAKSCLKWLTDEASDKQICVPWALIPCLNPDGYALGQRGNGHQVDLNRNYPSRNWSPDYKSERYHPGPQPGSEPEIKALVRLIEQLSPRLLIHCHSWNPCIVLSGPPAQEDAEALASSSGYSIIEDIGYPTPGSLSQYGWQDRKIPVICIEEAENCPNHQIWPHFAQGFATIFANPSQRLAAPKPNIL